MEALQLIWLKSPYWTKLFSQLYFGLKNLIEKSDKNNTCVDEIHSVQPNSNIYLTSYQPCSLSWATLMHIAPYGVVKQPMKKAKSMKTFLPGGIVYL